MAITTIPAATATVTAITTAGETAATGGTKTIL
jgi:hypothetical protein